MTVAKKIAMHPALCFSGDIADICRPLKNFNIDYFGHVRVDKTGNFSALTTSPGFTEHYIRNQYYNADIHMAKTNLLGNYVIWDTIERCGVSEKMHIDAAQFGVKHTFTIIEKGLGVNNYYHFATNQTGPAINCTYLSKIELLKLFILHFKEQVSHSKELSSAYDLTFSIDKKAPGYTTTTDLSVMHETTKRAQFIEQLKLNNKNNLDLKKPLTLREMEVLTWLHYAKTTNQIAEILQISEMAINKHIANIKRKAKCYTQFQLGEFFSGLLKQGNS